MTTATATVETPTTTIKISLSRTISDKVAYSDGYNIPMGREMHERIEYTATVKTTGKTKTSNGQPTILTPRLYKAEIAQGAYATLGNNIYLSRSTYDQVVTALAELDVQVGKDAEWISLEQAEADRKLAAERNLARMAAEQAERESHPGWCKRCQDYTYGDCGHN